MKPILCLDFDGVIHSYTSGWKGAHIIPDGPVPGAIEFVVNALTPYRVAIFSARSKSLRGRWAMKDWLHTHISCYYADHMYSTNPDKGILPGEEETPWTHYDIRDQARAWAGKTVNDIMWPWFKPSAFLTIDDRALTFSGNWRDYDFATLAAFQPWNKRPKLPDLSEQIRKARGGDSPVQTQGYA